MRSQHKSIKATSAATQALDNKGSNSIFMKTKTTPITTAIELPTSRIATPVVPRLALTALETADALGYDSVVTIHRLVKRGLLHPSRATRNFVFPVWEIERFLRDNVK